VPSAAERLGCIFHRVNNPPMTETGHGSARGSGNIMDRNCSGKQLSAEKGAVGCGPSGILATNRWKNSG
jgi:hypothetical protein